MPKVLHIGPCQTRGGMANVMRILAEHPPKGWEAELLSSHVSGSPWAKWRAYRKARGSFARMLNDAHSRPDIVHLHTAADWSWWRKRRFAKMAHKAGVPIIVHIHSGQFDTWLLQRHFLGRTNAQMLNHLVTRLDLHLVVLSTYWQNRLEPLLGDCSVVNNPVHPRYQRPPIGERIVGKILLLGRNDPVKGHNFAVEVVNMARNINPNLTLWMTGISEHDEPWVHALGWVDESKLLYHLQSAQLLLLPSSHEGQPLVALEALACGLPVIASKGLPPLAGVIEVNSDTESWQEEILSSLENKNGCAPLIQNHQHEVSQVQLKWAKLYESLILV